MSALPTRLRLENSYQAERAEVTPGEKGPLVALGGGEQSADAGFWAADFAKVDRRPNSTNTLQTNPRETPDVC